MHVDVIRSGSSLTPIISKLKSKDDLEVIIRPLNGKPSKEYKAVYWIKLRKVANHIGEDAKSTHKLSITAVECNDCDPLEDLTAVEFSEYFKSVMMYWTMLLNIDLGVI